MLKKAFTLIELAIAIVIIGIGLLGVFITLKNSYNFLQNIKEKTLAINFAREGVEGVFTIRNTNWQKWSGKKDKCWLKINPLVDEGTEGCENDTWFGSGKTYILGITGVQQYFYLKEQSPAISDGNEIASSDWHYLLCKDPVTNLINACDLSSQPSNYFDSTYYFRQVRGGYLLDKNSNSLIDCSDGEGNCGDGRFLEKNFCVDVYYFSNTKKKISLCTLMTNFKN